MNISLTPELEGFVQEKVRSGLYTSASEVIRESLRLMHTYDDLQKQKIAALNRDIDAGLKQLDKGDAIDANASYSKMKAKIAKHVKGK